MSRQLYKPAASFTLPLCICFCIVSISGGMTEIYQSGAVSNALHDLEIILGKMAAQSRMRDELLKIYAVDRQYVVENKRVKKRAILNGTMIFVAPDEALFKVREFSGSNFLRKSIINRLIQTERASVHPDLRRQTSISVQNYSFALLGQETIKGRLQYVLRAKPRNRMALLFDGTIWVDAEDFAVTRIKGSPAKRPSFWTRKVEFIQEYGKFGDLWFPEKNTSVASVFIFGHSTTEIYYSHYRINESLLFTEAAKLRNAPQSLEIYVDPKDMRIEKQ